jgi:hypothetical protein
MASCKSAFEAFDRACKFSQAGKHVDKTVACLKRALGLDGVITSEFVASGTPALTGDEGHAFSTAYRAARQELSKSLDPIWQSQ